MEAISDTRIKKAVNFHNFIHGFHVRRGARIAIMELKLTQEPASVDQDTL